MYTEDKGNKQNLLWKFLLYSFFYLFILSFMIFSIFLKTNILSDLNPQKFILNHTPFTSNKLIIIIFQRIILKFATVWLLLRINFLHQIFDRLLKHSREIKFQIPVFKIESCYPYKLTVVNYLYFIINSTKQIL